MAFIPHFASIEKNSTLRIVWHTINQTNGASVTATGGSIRVYKDGSVVERTSASGVADVRDFDSVTGTHMVTVDTSDTAVAGYYEVGSKYDVMANAITVNSQTVNQWIGSFVIGSLVGADTTAVSGSGNLAIVNMAMILIGEQKITDLADTENPAAVIASERFADIRDSVLADYPWKEATTRADLTEVVLSFTVTNASWASNTATLTIGAHSLPAGRGITVTLVNTTGFNGSFTINAVTATTVSYALGTDPGAYSNDASDAVTSPSPPAFGFNRQYTLPTDMIRLVRLENRGTAFTILLDKLATDSDDVSVEYVKQITDPADMSILLKEAIAAKLASELVLSITGSNEKFDIMEKLYNKKLDKAASIDSAQRSDDVLGGDEWSSSRLDTADPAFRTDLLSLP